MNLTLNLAGLNWFRKNIYNTTFLWGDALFLSTVMNRKQRSISSVFSAFFVTMCPRQYVRTCRKIFVYSISGIMHDTCIKDRFGTIFVIACTYFSTFLYNILV